MPARALLALLASLPTTQASAQVAMVSAADAAAGDRFGQFMTLDGDTAVIASHDDDCAAGADCGSVYVFRFDGTEWLEEQKLVAPDAAAGDQFGREGAAMSGDVAVIASRGDDCSAGSNCGSAYVFRYDGAMWNMEQKLIAPDAAATDAFGVGASIDGDVLIVGAHGDECSAGSNCGAAYVFRFDGSSWALEQKLVASDASAGDFLGNYNSISGDAVILGASTDDCAAGSDCGSAYVFRFNGATWEQEQKLTAADAAMGDNFGRWVEMDGDVVIIGASQKSCAAGPGCGAAYVFRFDGAVWVQEQKLVASDAAAGDTFGGSVAVSGDTAAVGAYRVDCVSGSDCGSAHVFEFDGSSWLEATELAMPVRAGGALFGLWVSVSERRVIVGAQEDCTAGVDCGAAYVYELACHTSSDCADADLNSIRDDNCVWSACEEDSCTAVDIVFADMGGGFGGCAPDGFSNVHDRNHALVCFSGSSSCDAINIDAGGAFGACAPDGFCNIHDANHALAAFAGTSTCTCPAGPVPETLPIAVGKATLRAAARSQTVQAGDRVEVDVFIEGDVRALRAYQLHVATTGGRRGHMELVAVGVDDREDAAFVRRSDVFMATNVAASQMLCGLDADDGEPMAAAYLATFTYRASKDASGTFAVDALTGGDDQTYLIAPADGMIDITATTPALITIRRARR